MATATAEPLTKVSEVVGKRAATTQPATERTPPATLPAVAQFGTPRTVHVQVSRKVSQNYNSSEIQIGIDVDVPDGADALEITDYWYQRCSAVLKKKFAEKAGG